MINGSVHAHTDGHPMPDIFLQPGSIDGVDYVLPSELAPNASRKARGEYEEVRPKHLGDERSVLWSHVVLLRPVGWEAAVKRAPILRTQEDVMRVVEHTFFQDYESIIVLALDSKHRLMAIHEAGAGGKHGVSFDLAHALKVAILVGASSIIVVHNHPSGDPQPSRDDDELTDAVVVAANKMGIAVIDHVVASSSGLAHSYFATGKLRSAATRPSYRGDAQPAVDVVAGVRESTEDGKVLRRLWGGHGKLVVRTGLVPPARGGMVKVTSAASALALGKGLGLKPGEAAIVATDGKLQVRGVRVISDVQAVDPQAMLREVIGFGSAMSASGVVMVLQVAGTHPRGHLITAGSRFGGHWLAAAESLMPVHDMIVMDEDGTHASLYEANALPKAG